MKTAVRSPLPQLNLVISTLNKPILFSFLSYSMCLSQLIIFVTFWWTHSGMSMSFYSGEPETGSSTPAAASQVMSRKDQSLITYDSFEGWNCLPVNCCNEGLNTSELMLAGVTTQLMFQSKGLFSIAEHHNQGELRPKLCWWCKSLNRLQFAFSLQFGLCSADKGEIFRW